ncbi:serine/threonine protein phosphatase [Campylobacter aviculae]|uniref:Serine/threonine protein phosphatase n=1 Tax=Campylobacter aviculae TaxID=2510190 RepID=A0A4U7BU30_9BACT|nr:serine/threonine protein phosphatase [Campylobacter aviculae]TKX31847.1 serine/threonine protein phosphatase [Campylobacter aviculae]
MRILLILRGNYYAGQEEFIAQNQLQEYTLDLNFLRLLAGSVKEIANEYKNLNTRDDEKLHKILLNLLEMRMQKGEFCIANIYSQTLKNYKELANKYRYEMYVIEFETSLEQCFKNNIQKAKHKGFAIPYSLLERTHFLLEKTSKKYQTLALDNWKKCLYQAPDLSTYKKIHHIGDIQGCYSVLKEYIKKIKEDEYYIFLGDYINRGVENAKVLKFLLKICERENVCLLEGNHENHLIKWANGEISNSKEFNENTLKDFKKEKLTPKDAKNLLPYFKECLYYKFEDKLIFCSHGGVNTLPSDPPQISFIPSYDFIYGVGHYEDSQIIANQFCSFTEKNIYQIFGHRNRKKLPIQIAERVFLCEGKVDNGGYLRVVTLDKESFKCIEIKNHIYRKK